MKKNTPFVDVIIPAFNAMPWLPETLESVLAQTYKNIIIYVIDDGSTDDTRKYMKKLSAKNIVYIKKANGGVSKARNLGIAKSSSPFIAFLDADDLWHPDKIAKQMDLMLSSDKLGLVYGGHYSINQNGFITRYLLHTNKGNVFEDLCEGNLVSGSASMALVRRKVLDDVGVFSEELVNGCEDWELWLRIARKYDFDFVPEIIADLRVLEGSMQTNYQKMADNVVKLFRIVTRDLELSKTERIKLASTCLSDAIAAYYKCGNYNLARKYMAELFRENPRLFITPSTYMIKIVPSFQIKMITANQFFGWLIHKYQVSKKIIKHILKPL